MVRGKESEETWWMAKEPEVRRAYANVMLYPQSSEVIIQGEFPFTLAVLISVLKHFFYFLSKQNHTDPHF